MQKDKIIYTVKHRKAFRRVEKELLGHNTLRGILHDLDKVFLYMIFDYKSAHNWQVILSKWSWTGNVQDIQSQTNH